MPERDPSTTPWLTKKEAAAYLRLSTRTRERLVRVDEIRYVRLEGGRLRFRRDWLDEWMADQETGDPDR